MELPQKIWSLTCTALIKKGSFQLWVGLHLIKFGATVSQKNLGTIEAIVKTIGSFANR